MRVRAIAQTAQDVDIRGPLGPMQHGDAGCGATCWALGGVAFLLAVTGLAFLVRRRGRGRPQNTGQVDPLAGIDPATEAGEFYSRLMAAVRHRLAEAVAPKALSMTLRELKGVLPGEGWGELLARAERAQYAGEAIPAEVRDSDLEMTRELLKDPSSAP